MDFAARHAGVSVAKPMINAVCRRDTPGGTPSMS
jgi:hypothetical protein